MTSIILLGFGAVGQTLVQRVLAASAEHASRYGVAFNFLALCDSSGCVAAKSGESLSKSILESSLDWKRSKKPLKSHEHGQAGHDSIMALLGPNVVIVDCSASNTTTSLLIQNIKLGGGVALANKKPLTGPQAEWDVLASAENLARLKYESTVGAGTPMVNAIERLLAGGDKIKVIEGTFSGTLGYLMSALQEGLSYSAAVSKAYKLGYTEPDPRDDLSGTDVARKALILARTMGWKMELADVAVEPLFPAEFAELSVETFMARLVELDADYKKKVEDAEKEGKVLRYVASVADGKCTVGLKPLSKNTPIGRLSGSDNMIEFQTEVYSAFPLVLQGAGAGGDVTAAGVLADVVQLAQVMSGDSDEESAPKRRKKI